MVTFWTYAGESGTTLNHITHDFCINKTLSSQALCVKHYISMYMDENLTKLKIFCQTNTLPLKPYGPRIYMQYFQFYIYVLGAFNARL